MNYLQQGIALNHEGVKLYKAREYSASASVFQLSASHLRACSEHNLPAEVPDTNTSPLGSSFWLCLEPDDDLSSSQDEGIYYVHTAPLVVTSVNVEVLHHQDLHELLVAATSSTLFNLALALHMQGTCATTPGMASVASETNAAKLYDTILMLIQDQCHDERCAPMSAMMAMMACMALNNRAHLAMAQSDYPTCHSAAHQLRALMALVDPLAMGANVEYELGLNCMRLLTLSTASAA